ncbi:GNAT family N-acetyltransferase, partial [Pantoea ananatis]
MTIDEVTENKKIYLPLLLLADEQEDMIDRYLASGRMFRLWDNGVKCIAVVTRLNETECELKNMATCPADQGNYGRAMLAYLAETFLKACKTMYVGTGDVP